MHRLHRLKLLVPQDLMYAISVDKQKKRVTVVFRGAITRPDWNHAFDGNLKKIQNPVKDDYNGRQNTIRVHRGFYTYLMRCACVINAKSFALK